jgi:hypothetical protein
MIPRNSKLPARKRIRFRTHSENQKNVKIQVVEGGDDRGINATPIGKCLVDDLPAKTPKGTLVDVQFDYAQDGRLTVSASLPELECQATMTLNRAAGLSDETLKQWRERIEAGLADPPPTAEAEPMAANSGDADSVASPGSPSPSPFSIQVGPQSTAGKHAPAPSDHQYSPAKKQVPADLPPVAPPPQKAAPKTTDRNESGKPITGKPTREAVAEAEQMTLPSLADEKKPAAQVKPGQVKIELPGGPAEPRADAGEIESALADFLGATPKESSAPSIAIDVSSPAESAGRKKLKRLKKPAQHSPESAAAKKLNQKAEADGDAPSDDRDSGDWKKRRVKLSSPEAKEDQ